MPFARIRIAAFLYLIYICAGSFALFGRFFRSHNILLLLLLLLFLSLVRAVVFIPPFFYHVLFCLTSVHICVYLFGFLTNMFLLLPAIVAHIKFNCVDLDTPSLKQHWRLNRTISLTEQPLRGGCTFYDQTKKGLHFI